MKKKDLILIVSILAVAAVLGIGFLLFGRSGQTYVTASVDGKEIGRWPLAKESSSASSIIWFSPPGSMPIMQLSRSAKVCS